MAMRKDQKEFALTILRRFKTKDLPPKDFGWNYIANEVGVNRTTLYRNDSIRETYALVRTIVSKHKKEARGLNQERIEKGELEHKIDTLNETINDLEKQLNRERERLVYATLVARKKDIDPLEFLDKTPLSSAITMKFVS
ncbi:hypothetical protein [Marinimicrobium sp. ABcell2]|uniref:hypothetical protein n=1 Tax=Marinimicrobium sp. ABcell2 TaxID=3069751 RepID=UPI0027B46C84|nr:hypothetical protein [Marinimicrobium sp. ABcell2]MDQ2077472.1 hypothetical protein [Marinimicrobium sp. ABcell2]